MSGGQTGSRGRNYQSCRRRVRRKCKERRTSRERGHRETTAAEEISELVKTAMDALARRVLADAERRTDLLIVPAFQVVQNHRSEEHTSELQSLRHLVC